MKSISASHDKIESIMNHEFIIPEFQRPYSWDARKCIQLFSDLTSAFHERSGEKYFLGNIIYYPEPGSDDDVWCIVDGQQRLTTLLMLIRALYSKKGDDKYLPLKKMIYKVGDYEILEEPRLNSLVIPEGSNYGPDDLKKTLAVRQEIAEMSPRNPFKVNYECLEKALNEWWMDNDERLEDFVLFLRKEVILLPIKCEGLNDALNLFEIINDRGMQLNDSDIFKAKIYGAAADNEKHVFIERWGGLENHVYLFRAYMRALKAQDEFETGKSTAQRSGLRNYIIETCLRNQDVLRTTWKGIMDSLEMCHHLYKKGIDWSGDKDSESKAKIYWRILKEYPNESWRHPLFVFVHNHAKLINGKLVMRADKKEDYLNLLESTVRFFFIKGVVYNSIEKVRNTTHKVCVRIEKGEVRPSYANPAKENLFVEKEELTQLKAKLQTSSDLGDYSNGLVYLSSFLNEKQDHSVYAEKTCGVIHIEHILPKKWRSRDHYIGWTKKDYDECVQKLGNLMPLEEDINIRSSDSPFRLKQDEYKVSGIQDALVLTKKDQWLPEDVKKRHEELVERLMEFFKK